MCLALAALALLLAVAAPVRAQTTDYDANDNRLIEIDSLPKLNAIRYDLNGDGLQGSVGATDWAVYTAAFSGAVSGMGCPSTGCNGYELTADLNFDTDNSGAANSGDTYWNSGSGWLPIGTSSNQFAANFEGNGHTLSNLFISRSSTNVIGLFRSPSSSSSIRNLGLTSVDITGRDDTGGLVGRSSGTVTACYVTGSVSGRGDVGGLAGRIASGTIRASYATASVTGQTLRVGGLVGYVLSGGAALTASYATGAVSGGTPSGGLVGFNQGTITASYAIGAVSGTHAQIGGLVGQNVGGFGTTGTITNSYYNGTTSGQSDTGKGLSKTTSELQSPQAYTGTIYAAWNVSIDGDSTADDPWDFGSASQYPALKVDFDRNGTPTAYEFGGQSRAAPPEPDPVEPSGEGNGGGRVQPPARGGGQPYNWRTDHPEIYANARHNITAACAVRTTGEGDAAITTSTITFNLAEYTRPVTLALSLWDRTHFRSLQSLGIAMPALRRDGQTATVEVVTDPARTRFRLDGPYGLNLVLGYADCHTDDS